jgi:hypothetical protein
MTAGLTPGELRQLETLSRKQAAQASLTQDEDLH